MIAKCGGGLVLSKKQRKQELRTYCKSLLTGTTLALCKIIEATEDTVNDDHVYVCQACDPVAGSCMH